MYNKSNKHNKVKPIQKLMGIILLIISVFILFISSTGTSTRDSAATITLIFIPLAIYLIFTKHNILY